MGLLHEELTGLIIKAYYNVYNDMGYGFLERVYENAMLIELEEMGIYAVEQHPITVFYRKRKVGEYFADIFVEQKVIVELKAVEKILIKHEVQLQNYLKATNVEVGLLLNFGPEPKVLRKIFDNHKK